MNARILEFIKNPEIIEKPDVSLLESEIKKHPYLQSMRALHLYGVHRHYPENYQNTLSTTAAFTTDKKILYQFINRIPLEKNEPTPTVTETLPDLPQIPVVQTPESFTEITLVPKPALKPVFIDGELNRILFEGEEDFLQRDHKAIDLEQTKETGVIVTQHVHKEEETSSDTNMNVRQETPELDAEQALTETESSEERQSVVPSIQETVSETVLKEEGEQTVTQSVNFHGTDEFLPEVKVAAKTTTRESYEVPKTVPNKHEVEMQRLIAEVEAKMKTRKKKAVSEEESVPGSVLDFSDVQEFSVSEPPILEENSDIEKKDKDENSEDDGSKTEASEDISDAESSVERVWKPMSFSGTMPDSLIKKETETGNVALGNENRDIPEKSVVAEILSIEKEEKDAFNISFFTQNVTSLETEKADELIRDHKIHAEKVEKEESNVPVFINTWQNWLKIDRNPPNSDAKTITSKEEEKNNVIETFIVKEPRISKLREESDFVVKEKGDNISHLMTETLAKLYTEQKLYSKAIKAYHILLEKHPDKKSYFGEKIKLIKELRQNK